MRPSLAQSHLRRLHELVTNASITRVIDEHELFQHPGLAEAARLDQAADEEIQALAQERGFTLRETKPYQWQLLQTDDFNTLLPRILRVLARDLFELDGMRREADDDDVEALASRLYGERRSLQQALEKEHPEFTLPGAK